MSARKIIDPKQNGEKVWLKGHAQATFMSDGSTVEDAINSIEIPSLDEYVTETELNDKGFLTEHQDISHLASRNWVESQGYAHQEDLLEISFNDIQDSPISIDDSGMINFVDESGNVGFQINEEGLRVTDVIAGEHKLSEKANASDIPSLDGYAKTEDIPSLDGLVKSEDLPNFDEFAKTEDIPSLNGYASKEWVNKQEFAHQGDLLNMSFNDIQDSPITENNDGEVNIVDDKGNIALKVNDEGLYVKDVIAGDHVLSQKQDVISDIDTIRSNAANYKATVTSIKIDNVSKLPSNGEVDLGYINKKITTSTSSSMSLSPNVYYRNTSTSLSSLTITLGNVSNSDIINEYFVEFTTRSSGTTVSFPSSVKWADGITPTWEAGYTYHVSIINNLGSYQKFK